MTTRDRIIEIASAEIGPGRRADYWREVLGYDPGPGKAWCGAFCLFVLHQAGLARDHKWGIDGSGMVGPLKLRRTSTPSRGDIVYLDAPFQHHALFDYEYDGWVHSVDGNQPDVRQKKRRKEGLAFFSISSLLELTEQETQPGPPKHPTLRIGSMGEAVKLLQTRLNAHGASLTVDGGFGLKTDLAVRAFQTATGLKPDGAVGPVTWGKLLE
jgi:hypothetical protein